MKTIKQIADEIGVSKTAIRKKMPLEVKTKFLETRNNVIYILPEGEILIKSAFKNKCAETKFVGVSGNQFPPVSDEVSTLISMLQNELDTKNEQIKELNARLAESNTALVAAQQTAQAAQALHAGTIQQQLLPEAPEASVVAGIVEEPPAKRRGFFGWLNRVK